MHPKTFYRTYQADDKLSVLSVELINQVMKFYPVHCLDFGAGTGKHSNLLRASGVSMISMDISFLNCVTAKGKYELPCIMCADETFLRNLSNIDCVFTCSVLDHVEKVADIINEFKRMANKAVILAETNDVPGEFYYPHAYEDYGFEKIDFEYTGDDGAKYYIWVWKK